MPPSDPQCIFCRVVAREIPSRPVFEDGAFYAFPDIHPSAPVDILVVPKGHILRSVADMGDEHVELVGRLVRCAAAIAEAQGIAADGYRIVLNSGHNAGQEVEHLHLHILGGKVLGPLG